MFKDLDKVELKSKVSYLPEGVHTVKIMELSTSEQRENYKGTPYTEFKVQNQQGIAYLRMSGYDDNTSEAAKDIRNKIFKGFLVAAGATSFAHVPTACREVLGNVIEVCLGTREYWTNDKETGEPVIRKVTEYKTAAPKGHGLQYDPQYNRTLSEKDQAAYKAAHDAYINANSSAVADEDLPF